MVILKTLALLNKNLEQSLTHQGSDHNQDLVSQVGEHYTLSEWIAIVGSGHKKKTKHNVGMVLQGMLRKNQRMITRALIVVGNNAPCSKAPQGQGQRNKDGVSWSLSKDECEELSWL